MTLMLVTDKRQGLGEVMGWWKTPPNCSQFPFSINYCQPLLLRPSLPLPTTRAVLQAEGSGAEEQKHLHSSPSCYTNKLSNLQEIPGLSATVSSSGHWGQRYLLYVFHRLGMSCTWKTRCENALKSLKALSTCKLWFLSLPTLSEMTLYISFCDKEG